MDWVDQTLLTLIVEIGMPERHRISKESQRWPTVYRFVLYAIAARKFYAEPRIDTAAA